MGNDKWLQLGTKPLNAITKRRISRLLAVAALSLWPAHRSAAATLTFHVTDNGRPIIDAVIAAVPDGPEPDHRPHARAVMVQQSQQFNPFVLPIQVGTTVDFPNRDPFRHHVYSFSPAKSFELKLYSGDQKQRVTFDKPGVVALGCNIHDNMLAYIYVVPTPYFIKTDENGIGSIRDLPAGAYSLTLWHPDERTKPPAQPITVTADTNQDLELKLELKGEIRQRPPAAIDESTY